MKHNTKTEQFPPLHLFHSSINITVKQSTLCHVIDFLPHWHSTTALKVSTVPFRIHSAQLSIPGKLSGSSLVHVCHKISVLTAVLLKTPALCKVTLSYVGWFLKLCEGRQSSEYTRLPNNTVTSQKTSVLGLKTAYLKNVSTKSHSVCKTVQLPAWTGVTPYSVIQAFNDNTTW
jgi:hypothetical protein